jgi:hypothetical protein
MSAEPKTLVGSVYRQLDHPLGQVHRLADIAMKVAIPFCLIGFTVFSLDVDTEEMGSIR